MKNRRNPPTKGLSRLSQTKQAKIIGARYAGLSERKIVQATGISRNAVRRVLSQTEVKAMLEGYRDDYRAIVPLALDLIRNDLSIRPKKGKHANPDSLKAAIEITKGAQVAVPMSKGEL